MDHHNSQCTPRQCPYCRAHLSPQKMHQCQHVEKRISSTSATRTLQQLLLTPTWNPSLIKAFQKLEREKEKEVQPSKRRRPLPSPSSAPSPSSSASSISPLPFSPSLSSASTAKSVLQCPYCGEPCVPNLMHYCTHIEPLLTPRSNQPSPETVVFNKKQTYIKSVKESAEKLPTTTARNNCPALSANADDGETNDSLTIPPLPKQCPYCLEHFSQEKMHQCKHIEVGAMRKKLTRAMLPNEGANMSKNNNNDNKTATTFEACQKRKADFEGGQLLDQYLKPRPANIARAGARRSPPNGSKLYRCDFCTKSDFVDFAHYMGHRLVHISERPHQCDQCSSAFARRSTLIRHIKESHSSSFSSSHSPATFTALLQTPNQCQQQQEQQQQQQQQQSESEFETEAELDPGISSGPEPYLELRIKQESDTEPETELTATEPKKLKQLELQVQTENNTIKSEQQRRPHLYRCDLCPNEYATKSWLYKHLSLEHIDHGEHRYRCDHCQEGFSTKGDLQGHLRAFKGEHSWRFKCETCQKRFQWMHTLKFHRKVHHPW